MSKSKLWNWPTAIAVLWLCFNLALASWWIIFGLRQVELVSQMEHTHREQFLSQQRMLVWEGGVLIASLLGGGIALLYLIKRQRKQNQKIREFFASFTHELKTSIASLRLQAQSLEEDLSEQSQNPLLKRLLADTVRLDLQLENSLFLSQEGRGKLFLEKLDLSRVIDSLQLHWPTLKLHTENIAPTNAIISADKRALESIFKNLIQNAWTHGKAKNVYFIQLEESVDEITILVKDDGKGFKGNEKELGQLFSRQGSTSGSAVGLYLVKELMSRMNGNWFFKANTSGFENLLVFKKAKL